MDFLIDLLKTMGLKDGLFAFFFLAAHLVIFSSYRGRLKDRQGEIDRLASENAEYRNRFLKLMDREFSLPLQNWEKISRKMANEEEIK